MHFGPGCFETRGNWILDILTEVIMALGILRFCVLLTWIISNNAFVGLRCFGCG